MEFKAAIFDLDGVIVDTAKYHYLAWKRLAAEKYGFEFSEHENERLKGVSRMRSLEILLECGGITGLSEEEMAADAALKNEWYVEYISKIDASELLPGAREYLVWLHEQGIKTALGSASKNAGIILKNIGVTELFDAIIDGNSVSRAKPDPEVFLCGARALGIDPANCIVFEDAEAGIEAAIAGGMKCVGIGDPVRLSRANAVIPGLFKAQELDTASF